MLAMLAPWLSISFVQMVPSLFLKAPGTCSKKTTQTNKMDNQAKAASPGYILTTTQAPKSTQKELSQNCKMQLFTLAQYH